MISRKLLWTHLAVGIAAIILAGLLPVDWFWSFAAVLLIGVGFSQAAMRTVRRAVAHLTETVGDADKSVNSTSGADPEFDGILAAISNARSKLADGVSELKAEKHRAELVLDNMRDGVLLIDGESKVIIANTAAGRIFEQNTRDFVGRPLIYAIHSQELTELTAKAISTSEEAEAYIDVLMPTPKQLRVLTLPVSDEDKLAAALLVIQDVTQSHRLDLIRRDFVANVSHELKTPVAGISLLAESTEKSFAKDTAAAKRFVGKLAHEAKVLSQLVSDLLDLSQLESADFKPIFKPIALPELLLTVVDSRIEAAAVKGLSLRTELTADLPSISGSDEQLKLMVRNLIDNAVHYTHTGGDILVLAKKSKSGVVIEVRDTGIGIPAAELDRVFERFYRVDKARSRQTGGTGLGLSIVKHVVENHHGSIEVKSTVGVGSRFIVSLPTTTG